METPRIALKLGIILALIIAVIFYFNLNQEKTLVSSAEQDAKQSTSAQNTPTQAQADNLSKTTATPKPDNPLEAKGNDLHLKVKKMEKIGFVKDIRQFLDNNKIEELSIKQKLELASSLQQCGRFPRHDKEAMEERRTQKYFSGIEGLHENDEKWFSMCEKVTDEEILMSYDLVLESASTGDVAAINALHTTQHPDELKVQMDNEFDELDYESIRKSMSANLYPLLEDSIKKGNVLGALMLGFDYESGVMKPKNLTKSLSYFFAGKQALNTNKFDAMIKKLSNDLFESDIKEAQRQANQLLSIWKNLDTLYYY